LANSLELAVEDHGKGIAADRNGRGIGLVAMRERAELIGGELELRQPADGGTTITLRIPREKAETRAE
jgi:signal transduction histidine kinase